MFINTNFNRILMTCKIYPTRSLYVIPTYYYLETMNGVIVTTLKDPSNKYLYTY